MNDKQLYSQILGIRNPWSVNTIDLDMKSKKITITVSFATAHFFKCPKCSKKSSRYDKVHRSWRHLDTCQFETIVEADIPRINCTEHGVHQVQIPWAEAGSKFTLLFESLVINWLKEATISGVANNINLSWDSVHGIQKRAVERGLSRRAAQFPKNIMIDETSEKKGHNYLAIVSEGKKVLHVAEGRDRKAIDSFWPTLSEKARNGIESVSVDLWKAFRSSTLENVPNAEEKICLDRFHVAGYFGKAVDSVRKSEHRNLMSDGDETLKGMKYQFLYSNVDNRSRKGFLAIAKSSLKTARAWAMKETAYLLWDYLYIGLAEKKWKKLLTWMRRSRLNPMKKLAGSLKKYLWMILNAIRIGVSSGCAEGNNSRIQKVKKKACGFRNSENFKNAIYFHLGELDLMPRVLPT